jgi:hypothetical protein
VSRHEKLTGKRLARGLHFNVSMTPETQPWLELLDNGTFSKDTLAQTPRSFQVRGSDETLMPVCDSDTC